MGDQKLFRAGALFGLADLNGLGGGRGWMLAGVARDGLREEFHEGIDLLIGEDATFRFGKSGHHGADPAGGDPFLPKFGAGGVVERMEIGNHGSAIGRVMAIGADALIKGLAENGEAILVGGRFSVALDAILVFENDLAVSKGGLHVFDPVHIAHHTACCHLNSVGGGGNVYLDDQGFDASSGIDGHRFHDRATFSNEIHGHFDRAVCARLKPPRLSGKLCDGATAGGPDAVHRHDFFGNVGEPKSKMSTGLANLRGNLLGLGIPSQVSGRLEFWSRRDGYGGIGNHHGFLGRLRSPERRNGGGRLGRSKRFGTNGRGWGCGQRRRLGS